LKKGKGRLFYPAPHIVNAILAGYGGPRPLAGQYFLLCGMYTFYCSTMEPIIRVAQTTSIAASSGTGTVRLAIPEHDCPLRSVHIRRSPISTKHTITKSI